MRCVRTALVVASCNSLDLVAATCACVGTAGAVAAFVAVGFTSCLAADACSKISDCVVGSILFFFFFSFRLFVYANINIIINKASIMYSLCLVLLVNNQLLISCND